MNTRYISTAIPYVNAAPHVGFALELLIADVLARRSRARGEEVYFCRFRQRWTAAAR